MKIDLILSRVVEWAESRSNIMAVALVGSWARGTAREYSDIDLMFLTPDATEYRNEKEWMQEIGWEVLGSKVDSWEDRDYGLVWSRHICLEDGTAVEFSFGSPDWAATQPIDGGTFSVVKDGCKILYDPTALLAKLIAEVRSVSEA